MKTYLNQISGIDDAIVSMFMSKRSWTREKELHIREICRTVLRADGGLREYDSAQADAFAEFADWMDKLTKWGWKHTTMLRFIDMSVTVEGLHRAGQDDWDAHAKRFNNRIIRSSTRLASFPMKCRHGIRIKSCRPILRCRSLALRCRRPSSTMV